MNNITVLSAVENDSGTLDLMIRSLIKFSDDPPKIVLSCNNYQEYTNISSIYKDKNFIRVIKNDIKLSGGSNRHGAALNFAFKEVSTEYTAVVESDCIVLSNQWCQIPDNKVMVAAKKSKNLYHVCFLIFRTNALKDIDFRAGNDNNRSNRTYKSNEDVGWQIGKNIKENDIGLLNFIDCKTGRGKYFDNTFQSDEFHDANGNVLAAHLGRGSNISGKAIRPGFATPKEQMIKWKMIVEELIK